jgi:hypothetical protein
MEQKPTGILKVVRNVVIAIAAGAFVAMGMWAVNILLSGMIPEQTFSGIMGATIGLSFVWLHTDKVR